MKTLDREQLKAKLDQGEKIQLVMAMNRYAFESAHIPGSMNFEDCSEASRKLDPREEVVVYCSTPYCNASSRAYQILRRRGFKNLYRYAGGLEDWEKAGYPLEGRIAVSHKN